MCPVSLELCFVLQPSQRSRQPVSDLLGFKPSRFEAPHYGALTRFVRVFRSCGDGLPALTSSSRRPIGRVNAKFDTGFPPTAETFEVVIVSR